MGHRAYKKYNMKNKIFHKTNCYRCDTNEFFKNIESVKLNLGKKFKEYEKNLNINLNVPKPGSKSGKLLKQCVVGVFVLIIAGLTIGFPVTICICLLALFLLIYK
ncbi:hypothetical protein [Clostridium massiliamazoniense]|uniref:hypothetical protein n=1 Tax=Clostridium massiliamazoniense TaxID=1347366 RepID=UPI0006D7AD9D|nr:hypothetical protein [Clostridium massiliamazoniense]